MKAAFGFLLLSCLFLSCAQEVEQKSLVQDAPSLEDHFSAAAVVSKEVRWAKGFAFYEDRNEKGVKLYAKENNWELEIARVARLKAGAKPRDGVIYLDDESTFAAQSTTQMALFESIKALEHLKCVAYLDYVKSEAIHSAVEGGEMMDISGAKEIDFEKLVLCAPDAVLVYPFGYDNEAQFQAAGIPTIPISEYLEAHPLGRSEWVKVIGFLCNEAAAAHAVFDQIEAAYLVQLQENSEDKPSVFTGSYSSGTWFAPGNDTFMAQFIRDAGGSYLFSDYPGQDNIQLPFETLFVKALEADFWGKVLYEPGDLSLEEIRSSDERFTNLKSFKNKQVFYCNAAEVDYFGAGVMEPHLILSDLHAIFQKNDSVQFHYFKPVER